MISHIENKACKVINVVKDDKQISPIESVTFQYLKNLSNLGLSTKKQK